MKYELIKQFPGSGMVVGETNSADDLDNFYPHLYSEFFKLVECNYEGIIIRVGDKINGLTIDAIDLKNTLIYFKEGDFMWMDKIHYYYSVIDWKIITHCGPPIIETQFTSNSKEDAEEFILYQYPCLSLAETLNSVADSDPFFDWIKGYLKKIVQKRLDERPS